MGIVNTMITDLIENTSENTSYLENTPQYISRIPQYIRQYPKLMALMSLLLEYFDNTAHQIDGLGIQNRFLKDMAHDRKIQVYQDRFL